MADGSQWSFPVVVLSEHAERSSTTTTTTTTAPPAPVPEVAIVPEARVVTPAPTTRPLAAPATAPASSYQVTGAASWYSEAPAGYCASPELPFGTVVTVTDLSTGASVTCRIDDRQARAPNRVIDMSEEGFSQLAPLSAGLVEVSVRW